MSVDKRTVSTDALETLGTVINENCKRDAIHLAVEPCVAGENLYPGQHIGIQDGKATTKASKKLGIVDPFIMGFVPDGSLFWLVVYPRRITSLRHVWEHPDFDTVELIKSEKDLSWDWIKGFADRIRQHPDSLMSAADRWFRDEDYTYDNSESYKDHWEEFEAFWDHYAIVREVEVKNKDSFFTCSC